MQLFLQKVLRRSNSTAFNYSPWCSVCILVIRACTLWSCLPSWPLLPVDSFASLLSSHRDTIKLLSISHLFCRGIFKILSLLYLLFYCGACPGFPISSCLLRVIARLCWQIELIWYLHFCLTYFSKHWTNPKTLRMFLGTQIEFDTWQHSLFSPSLLSLEAWNESLERCRMLQT